MTNTLSAYLQIARNYSRVLKTIEANPVVHRETDYYLSKITSVKTIDEFVSNRRLLEYAMKAHGLGDLSYAKAMVRRILEEGHDADDAFVNKLADKRFLAFAETFDFKRYGTATTSFTKAGRGVVDAYLRLQIETEAGAENEGVRLALYFQRNAPTITSTLDILADKALFQVVRTAYGLPNSMAALDIDRQIQMLDEKVDLETLSDADKLSEFMKRFASLWDVQNGVDQASASVGLLFGNYTAGISQELLLSLMKIGKG